MSDKRFEKINEILSEAVEIGNIPGAAVLVYKDGRELYYCDAGFADIEAASPINRDTIFRLYSSTKPITGAAAMLLMERGLIDLMEPVSTYLPGFAGQRVFTDAGDVPPAREVRIMDLLGMTSGIPYADPTHKAGRDVARVFQKHSDSLSTDSPIGTVELANMLGGCALAFDPGDRWMYGASADVMGAVAEVVTGKRFGKFLQDEFFGPLEMRDTAFHVPADRQGRLAKAYTETSDGLEEYTGCNFGVAYNKMDIAPAFESGGAGLASTVDDFMRFGTMLLNGGELNGVRILKPGTVDYFISPQLSGRQIECLEYFGTRYLSGFSYGKFMRITTEPGRAAWRSKKGEYGWQGWLGTYFSNIPSENMTILLFTQRTDSGMLPITRRIQNIILSGAEFL